MVQFPIAALNSVQVFQYNKISSFPQEKIFFLIIAISWLPSVNAERNPDKIKDLFIKDENEAFCLNIFPNIFFGMHQDQNKTKRNEKNKKK